MQLVRYILIIHLLLPTLTFAATQVELNEQSHQEYLVADKALNETYGRLMDSLSPNRRQKLKTAQRAWLRFRDAQAELVSSAWEGGSIRPLIHSEELKRLTEQRTRELQQQLQNESN
ncbi:lysozyme inhibitor LprI family protein [Oceanimonas marisflavi]|uniref:lysozyme inhibitor LprI family protein n=1 Tax=Oceanimonas marisflavi TaxID=2059724 RepID=UPI000D315E3F|nr:lysozyme inhibitor LprI family protein [Oceanimonas marisflavi]